MRRQAPQQGLEQGSSRTGQQRRAEAQGRTRNTRRITIIGLIATSALVLVGLISIVRTYTTRTPARSLYPAVDHIPCLSTEQSAVHFHVHVTIYINGKRTPIPADVGIAPDGSCSYWLHTHDESGVIHIETPAGVAVTFGNFLDIWKQQFRQLGYPGQFSDASGWQVYVEGKPFPGDLHAIALHGHLLITLAYNSPGAKPDTSYDWNGL